MQKLVTEEKDERRQGFCSENYTHVFSKIEEIKNTTKDQSLLKEIKTRKGNLKRKARLHIIINIKY